jgi:hypothetical protein
METYKKYLKGDLLTEERYKFTPFNEMNKFLRRMRNSIGQTDSKNMELAKKEYSQWSKQANQFIKDIGKELE